MKATASTGHAERVSVAVIGGGPAGATAALVLAGSGVAVALLEHTEDGDGVNQDGGQEVWKIGEGLPPLARPLLNQLGLWERFVADGHLPSYGNCAAWGTPQLLDHSFLFDPHGHGWHLDRRQFDRMLRAAAIEAGAMNYCGLQVAGCHREAADWQLELVTAQTERRHLTARFVVDASGRSSWFARRQSARRINADGLVGLAALLSPPAETPSGKMDRDSLTMVEAVEDGWWYASLLADGNLVAAYLSDGDLAATKTARTGEGWLRLLDQTTHLSRRVAAHGYRIRRGPRIVSANSSRLDCVAGAGWAAAGDAAVAYDPLSSQGILAALETGAQAAEAIHSNLSGDDSALGRYEQSINQRWAIYLDSLRFFYAQERRWPASFFWRRRFEASVRNRER